jgi:hypothetical protein
MSRCRFGLVQRNRWTPPVPSLVFLMLSIMTMAMLRRRILPPESCRIRRREAKTLRTVPCPESNLLRTKQVCTRTNFRGMIHPKTTDRLSSHTTKWQHDRRLLESTNRLHQPCAMSQLPPPRCVGRDRVYRRIHRHLSRVLPWPTPKSPMILRPLPTVH